MLAKPKVWFVDDIQSNLDAFIQAHDKYFEVTTFIEPIAVLNRLSEEQPDALLCDVFFYDTPQKAQEIEDRITKEADALRLTAISIGATEDRFLAGITLMEEVAEKYQNSLPFPMYAYTSKGPYLLVQNAWDRILATGAHVLLKNRYGSTIERMLIRNDIELAINKNSFRAKVANRLYRVFVSWGLLAMALGILIQRFLIS